MEKSASNSVNAFDDMGPSQQGQSSARQINSCVDFAMQAGELERRVNGQPLADQTTESHKEFSSTTSFNPSNSDCDTFHIVGIGASAGGLEALEVSFDNMRPECGMAFVVIQHLSPDFRSLMDELLGRRTKIPIFRVEDGMKVEPNAIYLIPPKKEMIISGRRLLLTDKDPQQGLTLPIDIFFRSLAQDVGPQSIGIVLSGTGSDGSRGIRDIHMTGGLVLAQDLDSARFDGMPKSAIETGVVDLVLPPARMPATLLSYIAHAHSIEPAPQADDAVLPAGFDGIFQLLRQDFGIDFTHYKRTTVSRRIQRRLLMSQITDLEEYLERLRNDRAELSSLYRDLLIGVTKFFRDPESFERLKSDVLPSLLQRVGHDGELRVWSAGCATGEEAYSLAILLRELTDALPNRIDVKMFATDAHRASIEFAGTGVYNEASLSDVSRDRLERFFQRTKAGYQVKQELRQMIVFAPHNIIKDAPFTKLHLIVCRNLLIYFDALAQKKALSLFHFGLNTGGVLFLGPSESPGDLADEFDVIDEQRKIYRKRRDKRLAVDLRLPLSAGFSTARPGSGMALVPKSLAPPDILQQRAYETLLQEFVPPSLLIDDRRELVHSYNGGSKFLQIRDGRPSTDVLDLISPPLKIPLATALPQALKAQSAVVYRGVEVPVDGVTRRVKLTVRPLLGIGLDSSHILISIEPILDVEPAASIPDAELDISQASAARLHSLENDLRYTKENLQATIEELETSNEELQATNEELVASNEELQSTNEELHSVNEELYTVNAEYQKKIAELTELTSDMDNLLFSTDVGVIFIDRDLCIRKFTPKIASTFHLLPQDVGRGIDSFAHSIDRENLVADVRSVLESKTALEVEVQDRHNTTSFLRILPYVSRGNVDGVVLTLVDISRLKRAETDLRLISKVFEDGADPIIIEDLNGRIIDLNAEVERAYGWRRDELLGRPIDALLPSDQRLHSLQLRDRCRECGGVRNIEAVRLSKSGEPLPVMLTLSLLTDRAGKPMAIASIAKDLTDRKRAEEHTKQAVRRRDQFLAMLSHELRNPLGAVLNASYVLGRAKDLPAKLDDACQVVQRQTLQMARLLDELIDVSRITQGKIEVRREVFDLAKLVDDAVQAVTPTLEVRRQTLLLDIGDGPFYVDADASRLLQVLENLLGNAANYSPLGGTVWLSLAAEDNEVVLRVRDNGKGIPSDMLDAIFELFVQVDDTLDRAHGGMGVGLTLVRTLVELHGGRVTAYSEGLGKGAEFVVRLPRRRAPAQDRPPIVQPSVPTSGLRIVLVEDNADSRRMLESLLRLDGYEVYVAEDGAAGLKAILERRPDVALVDIGLPGIDGYEVARQVRGALGKADIQLIALTGYGRSEDRHAVRAAGFDRHLVKPVRAEELTSAIAECCRAAKSAVASEART